MNEDLLAWAPGLFAAGIGLVASLLLDMRLRKAGSGNHELESSLADLDERASHFIALLRDLDEQRDRLNADTFAAEKSRLERLAADALRQRDGKKAGGGSSKKKTTPKKKAVEPPSQGFFEKHPELKGFVWGTVVVGLGVFMYSLVVTESRPRGANDSITGNSSMMEAPQQGGENPELSAMQSEARRLLQRVQQDPNDTDALMQLAEFLMQAGAYPEAASVVQKVLEIKPDHTAAQAFAAKMRQNVSPQDMISNTKPAMATDAESTVAGIGWQKPARWEMQGKRPMRVATYRVPRAGRDAEDGECVVFYFGAGQGGGVDANIQRWVGQMKNPGGEELEPAMVRENMEIGGLKVTKLDVHGTFMYSPRPMSPQKIPKPDHRMLAAVVEGPEGPVFFKLVAPKDTATAAQKEFASLLSSLNRIN